MSRVSHWFVALTVKMATFSVLTIYAILTHVLSGFIKTSQLELARSVLTTVTAAATALIA